MMFQNSFALLSLIWALLAVFRVGCEFAGAESTTNTKSAITKVEKTLPKRSLGGHFTIPGFAGGSFGGPWSSSYTNGFGGSAAEGWRPWTTHATHVIQAPSPNEVANAIAAAKQASANVLIAQQQMQAAKDNVLNQQRIAMEKEATASILAQKSEAAAAIQRSEAATAAQGVVLAQQRLAASKAAVANQQRIAAAREAEAAAALQRSAHAAAAEIQKTEYEASKFGQFTRNGNAGAAHHLTLTKDNAFAPISAGSNHVPGLESIWKPWPSAAAQAGLFVGRPGASKPYTTPVGWL